MGEKISVMIISTLPKEGKLIFSEKEAVKDDMQARFSELKVGDPVNLERAMTAATRFGGHVVQGHVDGVGIIISRQPSDNWEWLRVSIPVELMKYIVLKGSITIDGVSLTVNEVGDDYIGLSLIPETLALTTLGSKQVGAKVNVEADVMAKHIERLLEARNK